MEFLLVDVGEVGHFVFEVVDLGDDAAMGRGESFFLFLFFGFFNHRKYQKHSINKLLAKNIGLSPHSTEEVRSFSLSLPEERK